VLLRRIGVRLQNWVIPLVAALILVAVLRVERRKRPSHATTAAPAASYVAPPIPLEPAWGPLKHPGADLPEAVDDVLATKCRRCHSAPPRHSAPFPLYTWADTRGKHHGQPIYERIGKVVESGFMPMMIPANPPVERLTDAEKQTLVAWVAEGAPSASELLQAKRNDDKTRKPRGRLAPSSSSASSSSSSSATPAR
jgi:hypothetical protein